MLFLLLPQQICLEETVAGLFRLILLSLVALNIGIFEGDKESPLNEGSLVGASGVEHDYLFLFVPVLFENLLLESKVILIEGF